MPESQHDIAELKMCFIVEKYFLYSSFWEGEGRGHARKPQQVAFLEEGTS